MYVKKSTKFLFQSIKFTPVIKYNYMINRIVERSKIFSVHSEVLQSCKEQELIKYA